MDDKLQSCIQIFSIMNLILLVLSAFSADLLLSGWLASSLWPCTLWTTVFIVTQQRSSCLVIILQTFLLYVLHILLLNDAAYATVSATLILTPLLVLPHITLPGTPRLIAGMVSSATCCLAGMALMIKWPIAYELVNTATVACALGILGVYLIMGKPDDR